MKTLFIILCSLFLFACNKPDESQLNKLGIGSPEDSSQNTNNTPNYSSLHVIKGNNQVLEQNEQAPNRLEVMVLNASGQPVSNLEITFELLTENAGVFSNNEATYVVTTGSNGRAYTEFTASSQLGPVSVLARSTVGSVVFQLSVEVVHVGASLNISSGSGQVLSPSTKAPLDLEVVATDLNGSVLSGIPVTFTVITANGGILSNSQSIYVTSTNNEGKARTEFYTSTVTGPISILASSSIGTVNFSLNSSESGSGGGSGGNISFNGSQIQFEGVSNATVQSASQVKLFFNSARGGSGFTVYRVYLNSNFNEVYQTFPFGSYSVDPSTGKTFVQVTNLSPETNYGFSVRAMDALQGIEDTNTASVSITTPQAPPTFNGLEAISDVTTTSMKLYWTAAANASRYDIYRIVSGSMVYFSTVSSSSTSFNATNLTHSTLYTWRVRVVDTNNSADANTSDISQATASPIAFAGAQSITNVSSNSMQLNWTHVAGSLLYRVYNSSNLNSPILTVTAPQNYGVITGLTPGESYSFIVRSVDSFGAEDTNTVIQSDYTISIEAIHNGWTNIYAVGPRENFQGQTLEREDIRLSWKPFTVSEGLILGYNVYLSDNPNTGFLKLNTNLIAPSGADNESFNVSVNDTNPATDLEPLEPGKLYYFRVTVVVNGYEIIPNPTSPVNHTTIRVLYPPKNTALVHRWIVNQQICNDYGRGLGTLNGVNVANHYRCPFNGLGHTDVGGDKFYDYGKDMVVDVNELGCNFSLNSCTSHSVGTTANVTDCVGNAAPDTNMKAPQFSVYYFRDGGHGTNHTCFIQRSADGNNPQWVRINSLDNDNEIGFTGQNLGSYLAANKVNLPPLNWITQANAYHTCQTQTETLNLLDNQATFRKRPLRRKEYMGASLWSPNMTPQIIQDTSLQQSHIFNPCAYGSASNNPGTENLNYSHIYWPNRQWAVFGAVWVDNWRSYNAVRGTGAETTKNCRSRFGIQDMVGNIAEWLIDHIQCGTGAMRCNMENTAPLFDSNFKNDWVNGAGRFYNIATNTTNHGGSYLELFNWTRDLFTDSRVQWGSITGSLFSRMNTAMGTVSNCYNGICDNTDDLRLSHQTSGGVLNNFMSPVGIFERHIYFTFPAQNDVYHGFLGGGATGYSYSNQRRIGRFMTDLRPSEELLNEWNRHGFSLGTRCGFPLSY